MPEDPSRIWSKSVSSNVAETSPIVLRESETRRLTFRTRLVDQDPPLRGVFVFQRRSKTADPWEDIPAEPLTSIKAGEAVKIELHSDEVAKLMEGLQARRAMFERHGLLWGEREFVDRASLPSLVQDLLKSPEGDLAAVFDQLDADTVIALGRRVDLSQLDALIAAWLENQDVAEEGFWQTLLTQHAWVFSQLVGSPVVVLNERAYVGGKGMDNRGGSELDFLVRNALTDNVTFVEIKTPGTSITGNAYRTSGAQSLTADFSGGVVQVLGYRDAFSKSYSQLRSEALDRGEPDFKAFNARCILIAGTAAGLNPAQARSFELFRNALTDVTIWTFDEVLERLTGIRTALAPLI